MVQAPQQAGELPAHELGGLQLKLWPDARPMTWLLTACMVCRVLRVALEDLALLRCQSYLHGLCVHFRSTSAGGPAPGA